MIGRQIKKGNILYTLNGTAISNDTAEIIIYEGNDMVCKGLVPIYAAKPTLKAFNDFISDSQSLTHDSLKQFMEEAVLIASESGGLVS